MSIAEFVCMVADRNVHKERAEVCFLDTESVLELRRATAAAVAAAAVTSLVPQSDRGDGYVGCLFGVTVYEVKTSDTVRIMTGHNPVDEKALEEFKTGLLKSMQENG